MMLSMLVALQVSATGGPPSGLRYVLTLMGIGTVATVILAFVVAWLTSAKPDQGAPIDSQKGSAADGGASRSLPNAQQDGGAGPPQARTG